MFRSFRFLFFDFIREVGNILKVGVLSYELYLGVVSVGDNIFFLFGDIVMVKFGNDFSNNDW